MSTGSRRPPLVLAIGLLLTLPFSPASAASPAPAPASASPAAAVSPQKDVLRIAVLDFKPYNLKRVQDEQLGRAIAENVEVAFAKNKHFQVIERAEVDKLIKEVAFSQTGMVDPGSAIKVGKQLQARYVVAGSLTKLGPAFTINARLIDVETGAVTAADNVKFLAPNRMQKAIEQLIQKLSKGLGMGK